MVTIQPGIDQNEWSSHWMDHQNGTPLQKKMKNPNVTQRSFSWFILSKSPFFSKQNAASEVFQEFGNDDVGPVANLPGLKNQRSPWDFGRHHPTHIFSSFRSCTGWSVFTALQKWRHEWKMFDLPARPYLEGFQSKNPSVLTDWHCSLDAMAMKRGLHPHQPTIHPTSPTKMFGTIELLGLLGFPTFLMSTVSKGFQSLKFHLLAP